MKIFKPTQRLARSYLSQNIRLVWLSDLLVIFGIPTIVNYFKKRKSQQCISLVYYSMSFAGGLFGGQHHKKNINYGVTVELPYGMNLTIAHDQFSSHDVWIQTGRTDHVSMIVVDWQVTKFLDIQKMIMSMIMSMIKNLRKI